MGIFLNRLIFASALLFLLVDIAQANDISYTYTPTDSNGTLTPIFLNKNGEVKSTSWEFDLTALSGQTITSGELSFVLRDDGGKGDGAEKAVFTFDTLSPISRADINGDVWSDSFNVSAALHGAGIYKVTLTATKGDFWFDSSTLKVATSPVPIPSAALLLGSSLLGLAGCNSRKRK